MNTLHSYLAYYLLAINAVTFIVYGIDKYKAKKAKWRISEATLLLLAVLGGSIGAWMGMKVWHHKTMHPILEQVKSVLGDRIRIIKVDVDKYGVTASQYRIQSVPTLMLFRNGEVLWRTSGVVDKAELLATLDPFLT